MKYVVRVVSKCSYLFSTSTSAKSEEISELEAVTENLIMRRGDRVTRKLFMQIERMKNVPFLHDEIEVPISPESLLEV